jgi:hypothetical protein
VEKYCSVSNHFVDLEYQGCNLNCKVVYSKRIKETHFSVKLRMVRSAGVEMRSEPRIPVDLQATLFIVGRVERMPPG